MYLLQLRRRSESPDPSGYFEGCDRDIILEAAFHNIDRVLRMAYDLGRCRVLCKAPARQEQPDKKSPLTKYDEVMDGPMTVATELGYINVMDVLCKLDGMSIHEKRGEGLMPIHNAARLGDRRAFFKQ